MDKEKLQEILDKHLKWLRDEPDGERANLSGADLRGATLSGANLRGANLYGADLRGANLSGAYLYGADLYGADLRGANLRGATLSGANLGDADLHGANLSGAYLSGVDLRGANLHGANLGDANLRGANLSGAYLSGANLSDADLHGANLGGANLRGANLRGADLHGANLSGAKDIEKAFNLFYPIGCPSDGSFVGWKKARHNGEECIVKLRITEDAQRSSATGRKCRCDKAEVLEVQTIEGERLDGAARSDRDEAFFYKTGEIVSVPDFCENRWEECAAGIHFFITREEAVRHSL